MRFISALLVAAAATVNTVSCATVCYPSTCGTYTSKFPATTEEQKTTWSQNIALDKFDNQGNSRDLTKVTIKTLISFETTIYVTCTNTFEYCRDTYTGEVSGGIEFGMDLASTDAGKLGEFWGRWGDYPYSGTYENPGNPPVPDTSMDLNGGNPIPMFVKYTYPLFDVIGFNPQKKTTTDGTCDIQTCTVWAYYTPTGDNKRVTFYYDDSASGTIVSYDPMAPGYERVTQSPTQGTMKYKFGQGSATATPQNTRVLIGTDTYNIASPENPIIKSISSTDPNGGSDQLMTAASILALFEHTTSGSQIVFTADAVGIVAKYDIGGNANVEQETHGYVQMSIEYEYSTAGAQQDPQFVGFQGQTFQIHGYPGSYFNLISAPAFQMNGRFTYLANGHCNYKHTPCWTHPGTYIDDIAIIIDELLVRITAGPVGQGYSVRINDEPFHVHAHGMGMNETSHIDTDTDTDIREFVPTKFYDAATRLTIHLRSPLEIHIRTELFALAIHNADHFFNIDSQLLVRPILTMGREVSTKYPHPTNGKPWFPHFPIHGFIGQTWANATYTHHKLYQGDVDDYVETRPYSTESIYSQYFKKFDHNDMHWE